jgi:uncharacterized cupin superfamily protein
MVPEAALERTENGLVPQGDGWYVVNAREARWWRHRGELGYACTFEEDERFPQFGINIRVLEPGQPNSMYHREDEQEDFLVLAGECLLVIEGKERTLRRWDFVHCPPWTEHVFIGAGEGPCLILMAGSRTGGEVVYPVNETALAHGAGVERETREPDEAYARFPARTPVPCPEGALPDN